MFIKLISHHLHVHVLLFRKIHCKLQLLKKQIIYTRNICSILRTIAKIIQSFLRMFQWSELYSPYFSNMFSVNLYFNRFVDFKPLNIIGQQCRFTPVSFWSDFRGTMWSSSSCRYREPRRTAHTSTGSPQSAHCWSSHRSTDNTRRTSCSSYFRWIFLPCALGSLR